VSALPCSGRVLVTLVALAVAAPAVAQEGEARAGDEDVLPEADLPDVAIAVSPTEGLVTGDVVTVTITATARAGHDVAVPKQSFLPLEVRRKAAHDEPADDGRVTHRFELELLAFEPGEHQVGPVTLRVVSPDGLMATVETDAVPIQVASLIANEPSAEPKPPTEPVTVMQDDHTFLYLAGALAAAALVALLTLLIARWWRRRREAARPPPPPRPAHEVALERLGRLRLDRPRAEAEGRLVEWVDGVSDALREYLGGRYAFEGLESTTDEVLAHLRRVALSETIRTDVSALLGECDLVKFAQMSPEPDRCDALLEGAYRVVHRTEPALSAGPMLPKEARP
jgi:hypothetical protein